MIAPEWISDVPHEVVLDNGAAAVYRVQLSKELERLLVITDGREVWTNDMELAMDFIDNFHPVQLTLF